jgi:glycosyltransferase involved in cell wall biosynthesis
LLSRCLKAIEDQVSINDKFEVIIVDDGVSDSSKAIGNFANSIPIRHFKLGAKKGPAAARNLGVKNSQSEIVAFLDDDCFVGENWLDQIYFLHKKNNDALVIQGDISFFPGKSSVSLLQNHLYDKSNKLRIGKKFENLLLYKAYFIGTGNLTVKKRCFDIVGLFDEGLRTHEDRDFYYRLLQKGIEVYYSPKIKVKHYGRRNLLGFFCQNNLYGKGFYWFRRKWRNIKIKDESLKVYDWDSYVRYLEEEGRALSLVALKPSELFKTFRLKGIIMLWVLRMRVFCFKLGYSIERIKAARQHIFSK